MVLQLKVCYAVNYLTDPLNGKLWRFHCFAKTNKANECVWKIILEGEESPGSKGMFVGSSCRGAVEMNLARNHEVAGSIPGLAQWLKGSGVAMSYGVGCGHGQILHRCGCGVGQKL